MPTKNEDFIPHNSISIKIPINKDASGLKNKNRPNGRAELP